MKTILALILAASTLHGAEKLLSFNGQLASREDLDKMKPSQMRALGADVISGKVIQTINGGTLIILNEDSTRDAFATVFVEGLRGLADGDSASYYCLEKGLMEYTTVLGVKKTVRKFLLAPAATGEEIRKYRAEEEQRRKITEIILADTAKMQARKEAEEKEELARKAAAAKSARDAKQAGIDAKVASAYLKRAEAGDADAQYELGLRYLSGRGVVKDETEGLRLLALASKQGHKKAAERLKSP